jgi:hypothetical protein
MNELAKYAVFLAALVAFVAAAVFSSCKQDSTASSSRAAAINANEAWSDTFAGLGYCSPDDISLDSRGNVLVCGRTSGKMKAAPAAFAAKYSPNGKLQWIKKISDPDGLRPGSIRADARGDIYIAGTKGGPKGIYAWDDSKGEDSDVFILKLTQRGSAAWAKTWATGERETASGICIGKNGDIFVAGSAGQDAYAALWRFSPEGRLIGQRGWKFAETNNARAIAGDADGNIYLAINEDTYGNLYEGCNCDILKLSPVGKMVWQRRFGDATASQISVDKNGNVYFAGDTWVTPAEASKWEYNLLYLAKASPDGKYQWCRLWAYEEPYKCSFAFAKDNSAYFFASFDTDYGYHNAFLLNYAPDGRLLWQMALNPEGPPGDFGGRGSGIVTDTNGDTFLCWSAHGGGVEWENSAGFIVESNRTFVVAKGTEVELAGKPYAFKPSITSLPRKQKGKSDEEGDYEYSTTTLAKVKATDWQPVTAPSAPREFKATAISSTEVELSWSSNYTDVEGYIVERRKVTETEWRKVGRFTGWDWKPKDIGLEPGTAYVYRIKALNSGGDSIYSISPVTTYPDRNANQPGVEWVKELTVGANGKFTACTLAAGGDLVVAGSDYSNLLLGKFSAEGKQRWVKSFTCSGMRGANDRLEISYVRLDSHGNIIVAGTHGSYNESTKVITAKFSPDANPAWMKAWGTEHGEGVGGLGVDAKGNIYVAGTTYGFHTPSPTGCGYTSAFLLKYSPGGKKLVQAVYGDDYTITTGNCLSVRSDGHAFIAGRYLPFHYTQESGAYYAELSAEGKLASHRYWETSGTAQITDMATARNRALYLSGIESASGEAAEIFVTKYSLDDGTIWSKSYVPGENLRFMAALPRSLLFVYGGEELRFLQIDDGGKVVDGAQLSLNPDFNLEGFAAGSLNSLYVIGSGKKPYYSLTPLEVSASEWAQNVKVPNWPEATWPKTGITETEFTLLPAPLGKKSALDEFATYAYIIKLDYAKLAHGAAQDES